jgi:sRNA-binding carbon storage regulator CsrA
VLVLKRKEGQWTEVLHRSGDLIRIRVSQVDCGVVNLVFDDPRRNFEITRPERKALDDVARAALEGPSSR